MFKLVFILSNFQRTMWDICRRFHWLLVSDSIISIIITYSWLSVIMYLLQLRRPFLSDQLPGFASLPVSWLSPALLLHSLLIPATLTLTEAHPLTSPLGHFYLFLKVVSTSYLPLSCIWWLHCTDRLTSQWNWKIIMCSHVKRDAPHLNNGMNSYQSKMQII